MRYILIIISIVQQLVAQTTYTTQLNQRIVKKNASAYNVNSRAKLNANNLLPAPTATSVLPAFTPTLQIICVGESITFTNTSIDALTYSWDFGDGNSSVLDNPTNTYTLAGQYTVTLTAINGTLQGTTTGTVIVNNFPNADISIQQLNSCDGTTQLNCLGNVTNNTWAFSDGSQLTDTCLIIKKFNSANTYTVTHTVNPNSYCSSTVTKEFTVTLYSEELGEIPNVITPNFDGKNDFIDFSKYTKCGAIEFEIYDRWGLIILSSNLTKQSSWDGRTSSGKEVTNGTYFYVIKTSNNSYKGTIDVFR